MSDKAERGRPPFDLSRGDPASQYPPPPPQQQAPPPPPPQQPYSYPPQGYAPPPPYYPPPDPRRGGLGFAGSSNGSSTKEKGGTSGMAGPLVTIIVSVIISVFAMFQLGPSIMKDARVDAVVADTAAFKTTVTTQGQTLNNLLNNQSQYVKTETVKSTVDAEIATKMSNYQTKEQVDAAIKAAIAAIPASTVPVVTPGVTPVTPTTGVVTYSMVYPTSGTPISTSTVAQSNVFTIRILNGMATPRYVSFSVAFTPYIYSIQNLYTSIVAGTLTAQSTQYGGVLPITFVSTIIPTIPVGGGPVQKILYTPSGGGVINTGEYMLGPGTTMDIQLSLTGIATAPAGLWTAAISGSDRAIQ